MTTDISQLFDDAGEEGLSEEATGILVENIDALTIAGAQGAGIDDMVTDESTLACLVIDRTGSMSAFTDDVIAAYNTMLEELQKSKEADSIFLSTWLFNERPELLHGYTPIAEVPKLDHRVYFANGGTALYDAVLNAFTGVVPYGQRLRNGGNRTKIVVFALTDGMDNASRAPAANIRTVAEQLKNQEFYILTLMAFEQPGERFAEEAFLDMGFMNFLKANATGREIRRGFGTMSASIIKTSQTSIGNLSSVKIVN